jgi:NADPH:quinone reductase-like Zn-dependent oxidoreductase
MKAATFYAYGSPDQLKLEEVPKPTPGDHELLIKVFAASVNSWDWDLVRGAPFVIRLNAPTRPKHKVIGCDVAGRVESIGKKVTRFKPGDEVYGDISAYHWGGFAEYATADESAFARKSSMMTFEQAAATPQAGVLALQGLRDAGKIKAGDKVLLNGAGGGVGTFALQYAKSIGAEVTCVDSEKKLPMLKALGADRVIDFNKENFIHSKIQYDIILDVITQHSMSEYNRVLKPRGRLVVVGGSMKRIFQIMFFGKFYSRSTGKNFRLLMHKPEAADLDKLSELFESGKVKPVIDRTFPLSETAKAVQYLGQGLVKGKVVVKIC